MWLKVKLLRSTYPALKLVKPVMVAGPSQEPNLKFVLSALDVAKLVCKVGFSVLPEPVLVVVGKDVLFLTAVKPARVKALRRRLEICVFQYRRALILATS
jgi:hypothetical protein